MYNGRLFHTLKKHSTISLFSYFHGYMVLMMMVLTLNLAMIVIMMMMMMMAMMITMMTIMMLTMRLVTMTMMVTIGSKRHAAQYQHVHSVCLVRQLQLFHFLKTLT